MSKITQETRHHYRYRSGIVLLVTLVLLVVLSTLGYLLSSRVAAQRHRCQYITDYQTARYGCDSGIKYALAVLGDFELEMVERPNEPDFSDLFALTEEEYQEYIAQWELTEDLNDISNDSVTGGANRAEDMDSGALFDFFGGNSDWNDLDEWGYSDEVNDVAQITVRGPYGPEWPLVSEAIELEIGSATVRIEIEDENAKYPVVWMMVEEKDLRNELQSGFETFCEWMSIDEERIYLLESQIDTISEIKPFKFKSNASSVSPGTPKVASQEQSPPKNTGAARRRSRRSRQDSEAAAAAAKKKQIPESVHKADYIKLLHSSLMDTEFLAMPTIESESRQESALKYLGMWGSKKVNVNTAPRHVLEAAFAFGGDSEAIAEDIIQKRRVEPFKNLEKMRSSLLMYSDSIKKCEDYITTVSDTFTVRVTAVSGTAKASAVIAVIKSGSSDNGVERIAVISG